MTNPMSTDRHQYHSNLAPQTEHSVASTGMSAPQAPHSAVSCCFCRLLTPRRLLFSAAAALTGFNSSASSSNEKSIASSGNTFSCKESILNAHSNLNFVPGHYSFFTGNFVQLTSNICIASSQFSAVISV